MKKLPMKNLPWLFVAILAIATLILWGQLGSAQSELSDTQSKLASLQQQATAAQAQATTAQQQAAAAQQQATAAQQQAASAKQQIASAQQQATSAQQQAASAQQQAVQAALPEMHFRARWPTPNDGTDMRSYVTIYNDESTDDTVNFSVTRAGGTHAEKDSVLIPKVGSMDLYIDGWTFIPGDTLTMTEIGHKDGVFTVPSA